MPPIKKVTVNTVEEMKNLPQYIALIKRYESISLEKIKKKAAEYPHELPSVTFYIVKRELTGFGNISLCTLCSAVKSNCNVCVYWQKDGEHGYCNKNSHKRSYFLIVEAKTSEDLLNAYRKRAKHMRQWLKVCNINFDDYASI